jgi:hypothetical protein
LQELVKGRPNLLWPVGAIHPSSSTQEQIWEVSAVALCQHQLLLSSSLLLLLLLSNYLKRRLLLLLLLVG